MSWSEQEKKLKNKLLNYDEDVNNDELWASLSQRSESKKKALWLPIIIACLTGMLITTSIAWYIIQDKNNSLNLLTVQLNKSNLAYKKCAGQTMVAPVSPSNTNSMDENKMSIQNNFNTNNFKSSEYTQNSNNKTEFKKTIATTVSVNEGQHSASSLIKPEEVNARTLQYCNDLPILTIMPNIHHTSVIKPNLSTSHKKKMLLNKSSQMYVSMNTGMSIVTEKAVLNEIKSKKSFIPVLAYKVGLGMEKKLTDRFSFIGELFYATSISKLQYSKTTKDQIILNDTSLITVDEFGNNLYETDKVTGTKITTVRGEAYNTSKTAGINVLMSYQFNTRLNTKIGLGYNVWESHRGINYESLNKFNKSNTDLKLKTNYSLGLSYLLFKNMRLDAMCIYSQGQYIDNNKVYQRTNFTPLLGFSFRIK